MDSLKFEVPGKPRGKVRPRVVSHQGKIQTYTPDPGGWVQQVGYYAIQAANGERPNWEGPVGLKIYLTYRVPFSWSKKKQAAMKGQPTEKRPDGINVASAIADALESILYREDKQVTTVVVDKRWGEYDNTEIFAWRIKTGADR